MPNPGKKFRLSLIVFLALYLLLAYFWQKKLLFLYHQQQSSLILDRFNKKIALLPNRKGYYAQYLKQIPQMIKNPIVKKEDRFFFYHPGINPISLIKTGLARIGIGNRKGSSTISQQLVKILLGHEKKRTLKNKLIELAYTLALETYHSKEDILVMYANSIYFGNRAQGIYEASKLYFNLPPSLLNQSQILQLLTTISRPQTRNPATRSNIKLAIRLGKRLNLNPSKKNFTPWQQVKKNINHYRHFEKSYFEVKTMIKNHNLKKKLTTTLDLTLNETIRKIVKRNIQGLKKHHANNAAVIVIKLPENEIISLVGSPNPNSLNQGYKINMAIIPRQIGSTIKPFIYLKAFEKGLRPYTLVEDREYKYLTALGFPLYPKNFDYQYRGLVTLHYALSNSLNVPTVKVLEYIGLENFYRFLNNDLNFKPIQEFKNYQLGIALGILEMDLLTLSKYFTIFPNQGVLKNLSLLKGTKPANNKKGERISQKKYIQLINKILSDRITGVEQFGLKTQLNLPYKNYGLKTGTSQDFKDSWIIGYSPDFLVGVWVGNADNSPMEKLSGQNGAGKIWPEVMEILFNSQYNKNNRFPFDRIKKFPQNNNIEYGLADDNYQKIKNQLVETDSSLILNPHNNDYFLLEAETKISLRARKKSQWFVNHQFLGYGREIIFNPSQPGEYQITAQASQKIKQTVTIFLVKP